MANEGGTTKVWHFVEKFAALRPSQLKKLEDEGRFYLPFNRPKAQLKMIKAMIGRVTISEAYRERAGAVKPVCWGS